MHVPPGDQTLPAVQSDCTVMVQTPASQQGPGQMFGEQEPNRSHAPPEEMQLVEAVMEQMALMQHEPLHGFGAQEDPPRNEPLAVAHWPAVRMEQVVPMQQVPVGPPQGLPEQLVPGPSQSPRTPSQEARVLREQEVPTQQAPV